MPSPADAIVAGALAHDQADGAAEALLGSLCETLGAERALLARKEGGAFQCSVGRGPALTLSAATLARAAGTESPAVLGGDDETLLAVGLRPRDGGAWALVLARPPSQGWQAEERAALAGLRPVATLAVEHLLVRDAARAASAREARDRGERERLLALLSHELRNPLAPILMWSSALRRLRPDDAEVQRATAAITQAVGIEKRLIEDLLDASRIERGVLELHPEPCDLSAVVRATVDAHQAAASEAQLHLEPHLPSEPVPVVADPLRVGQAVGHLVGNAIKFTPAGGTVTVEVAAQGERAEVRVRDSGPGLPDDVRAVLFTPFVQGRNARGGLGLGLALAQRLVTLQRGTLEASDAASGGASFVMRLPLAPDPPGAEATT
jgi:signal transduction histidine kinase